MIECIYCKKILSSAQALKTHQSKTRYCLQLQSVSISVHDITEYNCVYCRVPYSSKQSKAAHELVCTTRGIVERYESRIQELIDQHSLQLTEIRDTVSVLKASNSQLKIDLGVATDRSVLYSDLYNRELQFTHDQSIALSQRSSTTITTKNITKNITMGTLNLTTERLNPLRDTFTIEHYNRGGVGSADWVVDNILHDGDGRLLYRCIDKNRRHYTYKDEDGVVITDVNAARLKAVIAPLMREKIKQYKHVRYMELGELSDDDNSRTDSLHRLHQQHVRLDAVFERRLVEKTYCVSREPNVDSPDTST